jgi:signal transduction histidine kinase
VEVPVEVRTHKLDRGKVNVFGNVTDVMLYWYVGLWLLIWWFDRAFISVQMAQLAFPIIPLTVIHFLVVAFLETPWFTRIANAFRFGFFTADRYVISHDPNPLPNLIARPSVPIIEARGVHHSPSDTNTVSRAKTLAAIKVRP